MRQNEMKNKNKSDSKNASEQLIISEQSKQDLIGKPPLDKKKLAALEKERIKAEKKLQEKLKKGKICELYYTNHVGFSYFNVFLLYVFPINEDMLMF